MNRIKAKVFVEKLAKEIEKLEAVNGEQYVATVGISSDNNFVIKLTDKCGLLEDSQKERAVHVPMYMWDGLGVANVVQAVTRDRVNNACEIALDMGDDDGYFMIHVCDEGYDFTFYDKDYKGIDGGCYDDPDAELDFVIREIANWELTPSSGKLREYEKLTFVDYSELADIVTD